LLRVLSFIENLDWLMSFNQFQSSLFIKELDAYLAIARPNPEIRHQVDLGYEIENQSVTLLEIRPNWMNPEIIQKFAFAKATFVKIQNVWKVYWMRSDLKWHAYEPSPTVSHLRDFLRLVHEVKYHCFKG